MPAPSSDTQAPLPSPPYFPGLPMVGGGLMAFRCTSDLLLKRGSCAGGSADAPRRLWSSGPKHGGDVETGQKGREGQNDEFPPEKSLSQQ